MLFGVSFFRTSVSSVLQQNALYVNTLGRMFVSGVVKTNKSVAKRFRIKGNGDLKRMKGGKSHNSGYKKRGVCNRLATSTGVKEKGIEKRIRRMLNA